MQGLGDMARNCHGVLGGVLRKQKTACVNFCVSENNAVGSFRVASHGSKMLGAGETKSGSM